MIILIIGLDADGMAVDEIPVAYRDLVRENITEALRYAAETGRGLDCRWWTGAR